MADSMPGDRTISTTALERMLDTVDPEWRLLSASREPLGHSVVYHARVASETGEREVVLKAAASNDSEGLVTESRLLRILAEHTAIPVPTVFGAVDEIDPDSAGGSTADVDTAEDLPTPYFVMESIPGRSREQSAVVEVSDSELESIARTTGEALGELHGLNAVDSFGFVSCDPIERARGSIPTASLEQLTVAHPHDTWSACLRTWIDHELETFQEVGSVDESTVDGSGDELVVRLTEWFDDRVADIDDGVDPVLARVDHGVHNLVVDSAGDVTGMIDWAFTLAASPGYDLQCVEYVLSGAVFSVRPDVPDRRELVRTAMQAGYRTTAPDPDAPAAEDVECYRLLSVVRALNHLEMGLVDTPESVVGELRDGLLAEIETILEEH